MHLAGVGRSREVDAFVGGLLAGEAEGYIAALGEEGRSGKFRVRFRG
jgi:hypothetical protein